MAAQQTELPNEVSLKKDVETSTAVVADGSSQASNRPQSDEDDDDEKPTPPWQWKLIAVVLVTLIRFGGSWAGGLNGSLKSTLKAELKIDNTKFALLQSCEDFMKTLLMLFVGVYTDRFGGASVLFWGNLVYSVGSILNAAAAQVRSFDFMIGANVIMSLGDISTQVAQFQVFSSWFAPGNGFASTLGLELMVAKCGGLASAASANAIAKGTGNFAWVYWIAVFVNIFTNIACAAFYWFVHISKGKYGNIRDPATGHKLRYSSKKVDFGQVFKMPWTFWLLIAYTWFTTGTSVVFNGNATELAEHRFNVDAVKAGWYTAIMKHGSFAIIPVVAVITDLYGNRITFMLISGCGIFTAMCLINFGDVYSGTIASFAVFAATSIFSALVIIDSIRTVLPEQTTFGTAYAIKTLANNSMNVIVAIGAGVIQDRDNNSYKNVVKLFISMSCVSMAVCITMAILTFFREDLRSLQWTRKQRIARGDRLNAGFARMYKEDLAKTRMISMICCGILATVIVGSWAAFIWGAATGNNY